MPVTLPLYVEVPKARIESEQKLDINKECKKCDLSQQAKIKNVCVPPQGEPGGLLVVAETIMREEDPGGLAFTKGIHARIRSWVEHYWKGPVAFDVAIKCTASYNALTSKKFRDKLPEYAEICSGYLASTIDEVKPTKIIALGGIAAHAILGRQVSVHRLRKGYGWLSNKTPVYVNLPPNYAVVNSIYSSWLEEDIKWAINHNPPDPQHWNGFISVVHSEEDANRAIEELENAEWVSFDTETMGRVWEKGAFKLCEVALCAKGSVNAWVWDDISLKNEDLREKLKYILNNSKLVAHNLKFDRHAIKVGTGAEVTLDKFALDTNLIKSLLETGLAGDLESCAEMIGMGGHKAEMEEALEDARKLTRKMYKDEATKKLVNPISARGIEEEWEWKSWAYGEAGGPVRTRYCARDTVSTGLLGELLEKRLAGEPEIEQVWKKIQKPACLMFSQIEEWGIGSSKGQIEVIAKWCHSKQSQIMQTLGQFDINWNSTKQVADLLYNTLGLDPPFETKGGSPSTDDEALQQLKGAHPVVDSLINWRTISKLRSQYADGGTIERADDPFVFGNKGLLQWLCNDNRFHPSIRQDGTTSGRPSCTDPNLFNIPNPEDESGVLARDIFIAEEGNKLVELDMVQIEPRLTAGLSGDQKMCDIYRRGEDYYYRTAQLIAPMVWGMKPEDVPKKGKERSAAKELVLSLIYGKGDPAVAAKIGCSMSEAKKLREAVLSQFKTFADWSREQVEEAVRVGYVRTWWDGMPARRRYLPDLGSRDRGKSSHAKRAALNTIIQGTASDYTVSSLIKTVDYIKQYKVPAKVVLTVYDSILIEAQEDVVDEIIGEVSHIMTNWPVPCDIPLAVDVKVGYSWGSMTTVK